MRRPTLLASIVLSAAAPIASAAPDANPVETEATRWFDSSTLPVLAGLLAVFGAVTVCTRRRRRGISTRIRTIPGLVAVEEAVGRATEMGRPILYTSGVGDVRAPGVLASIGILGWVSELVAHHGARLLYPVNNALNLAIGQQVVHDAYVRAGRADEVHEDSVYFISAAQFDYAAAVCGLMKREETAAHLFFGSFWSETLLLTETGAGTGAMQIAATDSEHQLPFFVATCDHVIIGEELYAASAYLTGDPEAMGSLQGQDLIKALLLGILLLGVLLSTAVSVGWMDIDLDRLLAGTGGGG